MIDFNKYRTDIVNAALEIIKAEARAGCRMIDGIAGQNPTRHSGQSSVEDQDNIVKIYADWIEDALKVPDA